MKRPGRQGRGQADEDEASQTRKRPSIQRISSQGGHQYKELARQKGKRPPVQGISSEGGREESTNTRNQPGRQGRGHQYKESDRQAAKRPSIQGISQAGTGRGYQ
jgi:hypothetical protein